MQLLIVGKNYDNSVESDILLLDMSNSENYTWTYTFDPSMPSASSVTSTTSTYSTETTETESVNTSSNVQHSDRSSNNIPVIIGKIIGSLFGCVLLSFLGFFLFRWIKNRHKRDIQIDTTAIDHF